MEFDELFFFEHSCDHGYKRKSCGRLSMAPEQFMINTCGLVDQDVGLLQECVAKGLDFDVKHTKAHCSNQEHKAMPK